ncbi:hypothetical protein BJY01DRAFT_199510 [Aspergillus pseudoustus]|uniref:Dienelactone hydrolase domain-containing protein n=1 Tax=Aspergillus pseudoustus TaxID=1810923 RepID=A0ABR4JS95_9EURO
MTCEACRTIPPVVSTGYTAKGQYEDIAGLNTYITGPQDSRIGLVCVYDVFGLAIQTLQGADRLASQLGAVVLVPDFFHGDAIKVEWLPPDTDEKKELMTRFLTEKAGLPENSEALKGVMATAKSRFSSVEKWAAYGLCWGGKLVVLNSGSHTPFTATGQVHPGRLETADAEKLIVPHIVLASKDEPADVVAEYSKIISTNKLGGSVETYESMWHGWMGARANLDEALGYAEYTRGYNRLAEFFGAHLK